MAKMMSDNKAKMEKRERQKEAEIENRERQARHACQLEMENRYLAEKLRDLERKKETEKSALVEREKLTAEREQESLADPKVSARQQCVYEDLYRRNLQQICN